MAKTLEWKQPAIDATIVVAGGQLINQYVVGNVAQIQGFMAGLPEFMGISVAAVVTGAVALIAVKYFMR